MKQFKTDTTLADDLKKDHLTISDIKKYFNHPIFLIANSMQPGDKITQYWKSSNDSYYLERIK